MREKYIGKKLSVVNWRMEKLRNEENHSCSSPDTTEVITARGSTEEEDQKCVQY
jgi:hypothetical protein